MAANNGEQHFARETREKTRKGLLNLVHFYVPLRPWRGGR